MSAAGELAISAAKDFIPARPSARFGSCCMKGSPKFRSTAVTSFFRKISIIAWRALAPRASEVVMFGASVEPTLFDKIAIALAMTASSMSPLYVGKCLFGDKPVAKLPLRSSRPDLSVSTKFCPHGFRATSTFIVKVLDDAQVHSGGYTVGTRCRGCLYFPRLLLL